MTLPPMARPDACLSNLFCRVRDPVPDPPPPPHARVEGSTGEPGLHWRMWHRESGGRCLPHHPFFIHTLQLALELDDNTPDGHCLSIVPESLAAKRALPWEERGEDAAGTIYQLTDPFIEKMWRNNNHLADVSQQPHCFDFDRQAAVVRSICAAGARARM